MGERECLIMENVDDKHIQVKIRNVGKQCFSLGLIWVHLLLL